MVRIEAYADSVVARTRSLSDFINGIGQLVITMDRAPREQADSCNLTLMALFARMDTVAMSIALAVVFALGLALATAVLLVQGAPGGMPRSVGSNLSALENIFPGYSVTWPGALIGAAWAGITGAILGFLGATTWNFAHLVFLGFLALDYPRRMASSRKQMDGNAARSRDEIFEDRRVFWAAARLNVAIAAICAGLALGLLLFVATHISLSVSEHPGHYLNLLGIFMPGYSVSAVGAWFGFAWGFLYGGLSGGTIAWLYVRRLGVNLTRLVVWDETAASGLRPPVLCISGHALGTALGTIAALQLVLSTLWLVFRGTADESVHAKLLSHYLPGYTVSAPGSLIGGLELFVLAYLFSFLAGAVYNAALRRNGGEHDAT